MLKIVIFLFLFFLIGINCCQFSLESSGLTTAERKKMTSLAMRGDYTAMKLVFGFVCLLLCATLPISVRMICSIVCLSGFWGFAWL